MFEIKAEIVRDVLGSRIFLAKYVLRCWNRDATPFFIHEFKKKDALDNANDSPAGAMPDSTSITDDDNSLQAARTTELLENIQQQMALNAVKTEETSEPNTVSCELIKFSSEKTHKGRQLQPVEALIRNKTLKSAEYQCDNCGRDKKKMLTDEVFFTDTSVDKDRDVIALCFYCARLPESFRVGCVQGSDESDLELMVEDPYGGRGMCDTCGQGLMKKATDVPETDDGIVWHGKVQGEFYDVCGPCAFKQLKKRKPAEEEEEKKGE